MSKKAKLSNMVCNVNVAYVQIFLMQHLLTHNNRPANMIKGCGFNLPRQYLIYY